MSMSFFGCSSDSDSSTTTPTPCPQGYTGPNCTTEITPSKIKITKIRIKQFPNNIADSGLSNPDIFIDFYKSNSLIYTSYSNYFLNANGDGSMNYDYTFITPYESTSISTIFRLDLIDYDTSTTEELMNSFFFSPYTYTQGLGFPTSFNIQDSSGAYKAEIFVTYEW